MEYTFSGNFRPSAQSHKIILFTDAAVKDVNLGGQVANAVNKIGNTTITAGPLAAAGAQVAAAMGMEVVGAEYLNVTDGFASGAFTFAAPSAEFVGDDATPGPDVPGSPFVPFIKAQLFVIQTGSDSERHGEPAKPCRHNGRHILDGLFGGSFRCYFEGH